LLILSDGGISKRGGRGQPATRKDRRKEERQSKRGGAGFAGSQGMRRIDRAAAAYGREERDEFDFSDEEMTSPPAKTKPKKAEPKPVAKGKPTKDVPPAKSILKKAPAADSESEGDLEEMSEDDDDDDMSEEKDDEPAKPVVSRAVRSKLEDDDDEIAALEKKLGMKGKKKNKVGDDELDWLVNGSDEDAETGGAAGKRKRPEDDAWLQEKRRKAGLKSKPVKAAKEVVESEAEDDDGDDEDAMENPFSDDEVGSDDFDDMDSGDDDDDEPTPPPKKERENPYVAPMPKNAAPVGKYIPPSLRKPAASDEEALKQLRRQLQGLLNRLSEANLLSILQSVEEVYQKSARQHVTSTMVDLLVSRASDPSILNETFLILHAGFATALFKVVGTDFGAQILEQIIIGIDRSRVEDAGEGKATLNLIGFLSYLYTFQLTGSAIMFDYIRIFLEGLSENNTELLLRMIRTSGQQLRSEDPSALKDIVLLLQRSVAQIGEDKLSVRTKFMIETINNLKNNRVKTGVSASQVSSEHTTRMKKTLGTLSNRTTKATEPLRISLADIRDSEKKGKWWLVGASYHDPAKLVNGPGGASSTRIKQEDVDAGYETDTPGKISSAKLARAQGMNTDVRRAIFMSILDASDIKDAHMRLLKLHLKNKQQLEIPRVLLHCASTETAYNPYYTLIARKLCGDRKIRKAFQFAVLGIFRRMGEQGPNEDDTEIDPEEQMSTSKIVNVAKLYGYLIADGGLSITCLKTLNFTYMQPKTRTFSEVLLTTIFLQAHKKAATKDDKAASKVAFEKIVKEAFVQAGSRPEMVASLRYFIETTIASAGLANGKTERKAVKNGCEHAVQALVESAAKAPKAAMSDDEDDGQMSDY
jgi:nucleolar MIF4G domain-containing protein 1